MVNPGLVTLRDRMEYIHSEDTLSPSTVSVCFKVMLMFVFNVTFFFRLRANNIRRFCPKTRSH